MAVEVEVEEGSSVVVAARVAPVAFLKRCLLDKFVTGFQDAGFKAIDDLVDVELTELQALGLSKPDIRRLRKALGTGICSASI